MTLITRRRFLATALTTGTVLSLLPNRARAEETATAGKSKDLFRRVRTQYIATLAEPDETSGASAEDWGWWYTDPGPTGVWLSQYDRLIAAGRIAPTGWTFNPDDWWVDENGILMENPVFDIKPGRFVVTGNREAVAILTIHSKDEKGAMRWELSDGITIEQVTHLECRAARYRPTAVARDCSPKEIDQSVFKIKPGQPMPDAAGCVKKDYTVLFVIGVAVDNPS